MISYVLGTCALIAFLCDEPGSEIVTTIIKSTEDRKSKLNMNSLNLLEIYSDIYQKTGKEKADEVITMIKKLPIFFQPKLTDEVFTEAGRLKSSYNISYTDAIALAEALVYGDVLLIANHHKYDMIEKQEKVNFHWIR